MKTFALKLEQSGRVLIPAALRKQLGLVPGEDVIVSVDDDEKISLVGSREAVVRRIQEELRPYQGKRSAVDELLAERHAEAEAE